VKGNEKQNYSITGKRLLLVDFMGQPTSNPSCTKPTEWAEVVPERHLVIATTKYINWK